MDMRKLLAVLSALVLAGVAAFLLVPGGGGATDTAAAKQSGAAPSATHFQTRLGPTFGTGALTFFGPATAKESLAISSITDANTAAGAPATVDVEVVGASGGACGGTVVQTLTTVIAQEGTEHLTFPEPLVASAGTAWCARIVFGGPPMVVTVVGFTF
jgi:hypothetical protein